MTWWTQKSTTSASPDHLPSLWQELSYTARGRGRQKRKIRTAGTRPSPTPLDGGLICPSFPDSVFVVNLRCGLPFQIPRGLALGTGTEARSAETFWIVPEFDVPHNVPAGMLAGRILSTVNPLVLQCGEERFGHRIVITDSCAADRMPDIMLCQRPGRIAGCVIAAMPLS